MNPVRYRLIQTIVYFLPSIRNPLNISLLIAETIHSPHIFPLPQSDLAKPIDISLISYMIDGFEASSTRKASITDPTIYPKKWTDEVYKAFEHLRPDHKWRAIPFMAGLLRAIYFQHQKFETSAQSYGTGFGARNQDTYILSKPHMTKCLQAGFVEMVNDTMQIYGTSRQELVPGRPANLQVTIAIFALATTLPFLQQQAVDLLDHQSLALHTAHFIYQSPQCLNGARYLAAGTEPAQLMSILNKSPAFGKLNLLSALLQTSVPATAEVSIEPVLETLDILLGFSRSVAEEADRAAASGIQFGPEIWNYLKFSLFSVASVLQGYINTVLLCTKRHTFDTYAVPISIKIIEILHNLFFIVAQISLAGFPAFDVVYYAAMDILLNPQFKHVDISLFIKDMLRPILSMTSHERNVLISQSLVFRGKIIFLLNITEMVVPFLPASSASKQFPLTLVEDVVPLVDLFLLPLPSTPETTNLTLTYLQPILESAHSVMLTIISTPGQVAQRSNGSENPFVFPSFFKLKQNFQTNPAESEAIDLQQLSNTIVLSYFDKVNSLFPSILSASQFSLAITTLVRSLCPPSPLSGLNPGGATYILDALLDHSDSLQPGMPLSPISNTTSLTNQSAEDKHGAAGSLPPTVRSVILAAAIHALPFLDISLFQTYLTRVWTKIGQTRQKAAVFGQPVLAEQRFLEKEMFDMISQELEQRKATLGIRWWYQKPSL